MKRLRRIPVTLGLAGLLMAISAGSASAAVEATTVEADYVGAHSAQLVGKVFLEEQEALVGFQYGETKEYGLETETKAVPKHSGWYNVSIRIKDLEPNTEYHFRFAAVAGTKGTLYYGSDMKFTTAHPIFETELYPAMLKTGVSSENPLTIGFENGLSFTCKWSYFNGEMKKDAESFTLVPQTFKECTGVNFVGAKVSWNGCNFVFHAGSGTSGTMDLACPAGKSVLINAGPCSVWIPAQSGLGDVDGALYSFLLGGVREVTFLTQSLDVSGLEYTKYDGILCPFKGSGTVADGTYTGDVSVFAEYEEGEEIGTPPMSLDYVG